MFERKTEQKETNSTMTGWIHRNNRIIRGKVIGVATDRSNLVLPENQSYIFKSDDDGEEIVIKSAQFYKELK